MFNIIEKHPKVVKGIMIAITATFVVWGISGYLGMTGDDGYVAKVGSSKIYSQDIDRAMDQNPGQNQDKMQVLFGLINRQLLINSLNDKHMSVTTQQLQQEIAQIPMFQTNGKFDVTKYENFLKQQYTTSNKFEQQIQQQILINDMLDFFKSSYFSSATFQGKFVELLSRERNVSQYVVDAKQFYNQINPSESTISGYYQQNIAQYTLPAQAKFQYVQLSADTLAPAIKVSESQIAQYLQAHPNAGNNEQVDASHILFTVPANATQQEKDQIKAKAEAVLAQVKANPAKFAQLAKQYSQDPGSAQNGGDLGFFAKGVMVPQFESVAFALKKGQVSGLVQTQFGYHIIRINEIKGNDANAARQYAQAQLQKQLAQQQVQPDVDQLNDITYNQPNSLDPVTQKLGLAVQTTDWVAQNTKQGIFANPKLAAIAFSATQLKSKQNSEVVDMGDGSYVVVRIVDYKPSRVQPLAEVQAGIVAALKAQQAAQMASAMGQQQLAQVQQGKLKLNFTNPVNVSLLGQDKTIDPMAVKQIFAIPAQFPAYTGAVNQAGDFVIYQINSQSVDKTLDAQNQKIVGQLTDQYSMMNLNAYVAALRSDYKVNYKLDRIQQSADGSDGQQQPTPAGN